MKMTALALALVLSGCVSSQASSQALYNYSFHLPLCFDGYGASCTEAVEAARIRCDAGDQRVCQDLLELYQHGIGAAWDEREAERVRQLACDGRSPAMCPQLRPQVEDGMCSLGCASETGEGISFRAELDFEDEIHDARMYTARADAKHDSKWSQPSSAPKCVTGKPCGRSCIAKWKTCHK